MYLIVGMLFGISISLFYIFLYSGSVLYGILCGIIGFVVIGLIHGLIVSTFSKITYPIAGCSLVIVIGVLGINGFILGLLSFWGMSLLPQGNWHQLKTPPEEVVEIMDNAILDFWGGRINVRTISDKKYTYDCWGEQDYVWTEFNPTQSVEGTMNEICPPDQKRKHYPTPPFPGKVVSSQLFDVCGADFTVQYNSIF